MTLITVDAVIHVPAYIGVMEIGRVVTTMTGGALEDRIVGSTGVARRAHARRIAVVHIEPRVIERGARPGGGVMAGSAGGGEYRRRGLMDRIGRPVVIRHVATVTIGGRGGEIVVDMATGASHRQVRAGQREGRGGVRERRRQPIRGSGPVAGGAVSGESRRHVRGVGGVGEVRRVTTVAGRVAGVQTVVVVDVAQQAGQ